MGKKYLLDTSVIIDSPQNIVFLSQNGENEIYITNIVLKELDKHKEDAYGERGFNARKFARSLMDKEGVDYQNSVSPKGKDYIKTLYCKFEECGAEVPITVISRFKYDVLASDNDLKIITIAKDYGLKLLTSDNYMRFSALASGVEADILHKDSVKSPEALSFSLEISLKKRPSSEDALINKVLSSLPDEVKPWSQITVTYENSTQRDYFIARKKSGGGLKLEEVDHKSVMEKYPVPPINEEQKFYAHILSHPLISIVAVTGSTGSGKTLLALQEGIRRVKDPHSPIDGIVYLRNTVTANDQAAELGFRKGDENQKLSYFTYPLFGSINFIIKQEAKRKGVSIEELEEHKRAGITKENLTAEFMEKYNIEVIDIAHARGITIDNKYVIFDEVQNAPSGTVKLIGTRMGKGSILVVMGDYKQVDHPYLSPTRNGLITIMKKASETGIPVVQLKKTIRSEIAEWFESNF